MQIRRVKLQKLLVNNVTRLHRNHNIMDNMLGMMEKYANNLEELVEDRTRQFLEEKKKTDMLLYNMMPQCVE